MVDLPRIDRILRAPQNCNANRSYRHNCRVNPTTVERFSNHLIANCLLSKWIISPMVRWSLSKNNCGWIVASSDTYFDYSCFFVEFRRIRERIIIFLLKDISFFFILWTRWNVLLKQDRENKLSCSLEDFLLFSIKMRTCLCYIVARSP